MDKAISVKDRRRGELLAAAGEVFGRSGYNDATVDDIALQAGVSKGSVYNYFSSKQEIFEQLFVSGIKTDLKTLHELVQVETTATHKLDKLITLFFEHAEQHQQSGKLALEFWANAACDKPDGIFRKSLKELYAVLTRMLLDVLNEGERSGEFVFEHGAEIGATLILALLDGLDAQNMLNLIELNEKHCIVLKEGIFQILTGMKTPHVGDETPSVQK